MKFPHRRTPNANAFNQSVSTPIELDETRAQKAAFAKLPFLGRHVLIHHFSEAVARRFLVGTAVLGCSSAFPSPPVFLAGLTVESSFASKCDIFLLEGVDQR